MNDKLFSIGKTASILNISVPTLRHYDKIGLIKPSYTDENTGYRYYSIEQFHVIDRIKYLQKLGFSLTEIHKIIKNGKSQDLLPYLESKKREYNAKMNAIKKDIEILDWYIEFFSYSPDGVTDDIYQLYLDDRYVLSTVYNPVRDIVSSDIELLRVKNTPSFCNLHFKRQWGCLLDYDSFINKTLQITHSFLYLSEKPLFDSKHFITLPKGMYICMKTQLFSNNFGNISKLKKIINQYGYDVGIVVANEYEDNFHNYENSVYEIQIQLVEK